MLSAETIRKFKRDRQLEKKSALRQGLQGQGKNKSIKNPKENVPTIKSIIDEPCPKHSSHYSLKALAYKNVSVFTAYSHSELRFILSGYGAGYSKANKAKQSEKLASIIKDSTVMPHPEKLTNDNYGTIMKGGSHSVESTNALNCGSVLQSIENTDEPTESTSNRSLEQVQAIGVYTIYYAIKVLLQYIHLYVYTRISYCNQHNFTIFLV